MNKQSISYLRAYINRYPTLDNLRYITKILNYLYYEYPDIRQIFDQFNYIYNNFDWPDNSFECVASVLCDSHIYNNWLPFSFIHNFNAF